MKEFKGSKAPWQVHGRFKVISALIESDKMGFSPVHHGICDMEQGSYIGMSWEEKEANAKLIASAPELLEALQECLNAMEHGDPHEPTTSIAWGKIIFKARKAINSALGE